MKIGREAYRTILCPHRLIFHNFVEHRFPDIVKSYRSPPKQLPFTENPLTNQIDCATI